MVEISIGSQRTRLDNWVLASEIAVLGLRHIICMPHQYSTSRKGGKRRAKISTALNLG